MSLIIKKNLDGGDNFGEKGTFSLCFYKIKKINCYIYFFFLNFFWFFERRRFFMFGIICSGYGYFVKYSTIGKEVFESIIQTKNACDESSGSLEDRVKIGVKGIKTVTGVACLGTEILVDTRILANNDKIKMSLV
jgi:hypothetical protein